MSRFRFAKSLFASEFATGAAEYRDAYVGDSAARLVLAVSINDGEFVDVIVDTGSPWCILNPETAKASNIFDTAILVENSIWEVRGISYSVAVTRTTISIPAEFGDDLPIDATVYIPHGYLGVIYAGPNFLGLSGFLDRMRFAVDPVANVFYFGPHD